jgi:hypothetical protein
MLVRITTATKIGASLFLSLPLCNLDALEFARDKFRSKLMMIACPYETLFNFKSIETYSFLNLKGHGSII